jgi:Flp pilus assembly protein TadD
MDPAFLPAAFNLATLLNKIGRNADAESVLRAALRLAPAQGDLHYSLGLLLAESGQLEQASVELGRAAQLMPERASTTTAAAAAMRSLRCVRPTSSRSATRRSCTR